MNIKKVFLILFSLLIAKVAFGAHGTESGGGTDNYDTKNKAAWYTGNQPILYCTEVDKNFGLTEGRADAELKKAIDIWQNYIKTKQISGLSTNWIQQKCNGSEYLKFYFGIDNNYVLNYKASLDSSIAHVFKVEWISSSLSKGFVWIAKEFSAEPQNKFPDWNKPNHLLAILLHEIGHIYGCDHFKGTVMRDDLSLLLKYDKDRGTETEKLSAIEVDRYLHYDTKSMKDIKVWGALGLTKADTETSKTNYLFKLMTGRQLIGKLKTYLDLSSAAYPRIVIEDDNSTDSFETIFSATDDGYPTPIQSDALRFYTYNGAQQYSSWIENRDIITKNNQRLRLRFEFNTRIGWGPIKISYYSQDIKKWENFFWAYPLAGPTPNW